MRLYGCGLYTKQLKQGKKDGIIKKYRNVNRVKKKSATSTIGTYVTLPDECRLRLKKLLSCIKCNHMYTCQY